MVVVWGVDVEVGGVDVDFTGGVDEGGCDLVVDGVVETGVEVVVFVVVSESIYGVGVVVLVDEGGT